MEREEAIKIIDCYDIGFYDLSGEKIPADKLADAFDMAIESLQGDMYCPNCGVRLVPEDEYLEPTQTHGRLIDAEALSKKLCETTIFIKDGEVFQRMINDAPTVQADRPHGIGYVGVKDDYPVSVKEVLNITAETGALETQRRIKELQPIDRPHGEWGAVNDILDVYICDQCGEIYQIQNIPMWHFCSNCGADMRKEKE